MTSEDCVYHGAKWRGKFQRLINHLRSTSIPEKYVFNIRRVVCVCPKSNSQSEPPLPDAVATAIKNLNEFHLTFPVDEQPSYIKPLQEFVEDALKTVDLGNEKSTSLKLWIVLAEQILNNDFSALYPQPKKTNSGAVPDNERIQTRNITLDLLPSYRGLLLGKKGWRVQSIAKLAKCSIKFNFPKDGKSRSDNASIPVTLGGALARILKAEERLKSAVRKIKAARVLHEKRVKEFLRLKAARREGRTGKNYRTWIEKRNIKELNEDHYWRRAKSKQISHTRPKEDSFKDGHCMKCLVAYSKPEKKLKTCAHHAGYLMTRRGPWSCCGTDFKQRGRVDHEEHATTGCVSDELHAWKHNPRSRHNIKHKGKRQDSSYDDREEIMEIMAEQRDVIFERLRNSRNYLGQRYPPRIYVRRMLATQRGNFSMRGNYSRGSVSRRGNFAGGRSRGRGRASGQRQRDFYITPEINHLDLDVSRLHIAEEETENHARRKWAAIASDHPPRPDCYLHGKSLSSKFQHMLNLLHRTWLPPKVIGNFCNYVCSCPVEDMKTANDDFVAVKKAMDFFPRLQNNPLVKQDPVFLAVETVFLNHVLKKTASEISKGERKLLVSLNAVFQSDFAMFGFDQSKSPIIFKKTINVRPEFNDESSPFNLSQQVNRKSLRQTSVLFSAWYFKHSQELQIISNKCSVDINPNYQANSNDKINGTNKSAQIFILGPLYSNILTAEDMLMPICMEELNAPRRE